jgi:holo-[acyl-carrier protein] synthase
MILGIGIDCVEISRVARLLARDRRAFLKKIAHKEELKEAKKITSAKRLAEFWAGRYAVKEAFAKALGTGFSKSIIPSSIFVSRGARGAPSAAIIPPRGKASHQWPPILRVHVSLSHDGGLAVACVVLES